MERIRPQDRAPSLDAKDLPVGTVLVRWYSGRKYEVKVVDPPTLMEDQVGDRGWWRYMWAGRRYKSLSAIAYRITGNRFESGNRFFGLRPRRR